MNSNAKVNQEERSAKNLCVEWGVLIAPSHEKEELCCLIKVSFLGRLIELIGISKTHIDVFVDNNLANEYWVRQGWTKRNDINHYSFNRSSHLNA